MRRAFLPIAGLFWLGVGARALHGQDTTQKAVTDSSLQQRVQNCLVTDKEANNPRTVKVRGENGAVLGTLFACTEGFPPKYIFGYFDRDSTYQIDTTKKQINDIEVYVKGHLSAHGTATTDPVKRTFTSEIKTTFLKLPYSTKAEGTWSEYAAFEMKGKLTGIIPINKKCIGMVDNTSTNGAPARIFFGCGEGVERYLPKTNLANAASSSSHYRAPK